MEYRKQTELPTIEKLVQAMKSADIADDKRNTIQLMTMLMKIRSMSPRLQGHWLTRRVGVSSFKWDITSSDAANKDKAAEAKARCRAAIKTIISRHEQTPAFGCLLIELAWEVEGTDNVPTVRKIYKPYEIEKYDEGTIAIVRSEGKEFSRVKILNGDTNYIMDMDESDERGGLMRGIAIHELLRHITMEGWANLNQRLKGIIAGVVDLQKMQSVNLTDAQIKEQTDALDTALSKAGDNNYIRAINAVDIQFKSLVDAASANSYSEFKKAIESDISIAILGQANTSELPQGGGSRAAVQVLNLIRGDILYWDMMRVQSMINEQLLRNDFRMNYDESATAAPWEFEFIFDEVVDTESNARKFEILGRTTGDVPVVKADFYRSLGLEVPKDGEEVVNLGGNGFSPTI
jgi:hypothetical protein